MLIMGLSSIVFSGLWVVEAYDSYAAYPKEVFIFLALGFGLMIGAYTIIQWGRKRDIRITNKIMNGSGGDRDGRVFVIKLWKHKDRLGSGLVVIFLVLAAAMFIFESNIASNLLRLPMFAGLIGYSFLYIMKDGDQEQEEDDLSPKSPKMRYLMRLIDYREHPFSVALILFMMVILTFILSKHFGFALSLETSGNPRYVMSLPSGMWLLATLVFACGFIYIIQHCHFFSIRQAKQSDSKLLQIHFFEIILCGSVFLIWLIVMFI